MKKVYQYGHSSKEISVQPAGDRFRVTVGEQSYTIAAKRLGPGQFLLEIEGQQIEAHVVQSGAQRYVAMAGQTWLLEQAARGQPSPPQPDGHDSLTASMPGVVLELLVAAGDPVERGQTLLVLEAMKMELRVTAPHAGQVNAVHCTAGQVVERGQLLVEITT